MPSFELSKLQGINPARALTESDRTPIDTARSAVSSGGAVNATKPAAAPGVAIEVAGATDPNSPPLDTDRVKKIRKALQDGTYPLVPTKIADAIIAARVGFGVEAE
ncbi:MAG: flagellar biosynthesis anti-sigma factor FlgM [Pseudomonadota bacterium]